MPNLGAVRRERFLTIDNPLNPPGVGWVKKKFKVRVSIRTCMPNLGAVRRERFLTIDRHVIGEKKNKLHFFRDAQYFPAGGMGGAAGSGAEPRKQTHIGNNLLKIVVLLYNFIIIYLYDIGAQNS